MKQDYLTFRQARKFARSLKLNTKEEWKRYCKGLLPEHEKKPDNIPNTPEVVYRDQGWVRYGDWLGNGFILHRDREYRAFTKARKFARSLNFKNRAEWEEFCQGKLRGYRIKPEDIPSSPDKVYKESGWKGMGDWLGTGRIANHNKQFLSFIEARKYVRKLKLNGNGDWRKYCTGKLDGYKMKPQYIPTHPHVAYADSGWKDWGNWFGTGRVATNKIKYRPFSQARKFTRSLGLKSQREWLAYCKGELKQYKHKPDDIPSCPAKTYKNKGWVSVGDWLGTGNIAPRKQKFLPFIQARSYVRKLKLKNQTDWELYRSGKLPGYDEKPSNIPTNPGRTYKDRGWKGHKDWIGTLK